MEDFDDRRRRDQERQQARGEDRGRDRDSWWRGERSRFSPDWSREGAEPRYSDDPYYSRNRERSDEQSGRRSQSWQDDDSRRWQQRPRDDEQGSHYRGYYSRSAAPFSYPGGSGYLYSESVTLRGPYAGRGPKGYKRSDEQIVEEASQRLERDSEVDASEIEVTAEDGVIRLRGTVSDRQTKRRAEECVESTYGVRDVMNELRVSRQGTEAPQGAQASQGSRGSQASQSGQGSQTPTPGMRPGAGSSTAEQIGDDKRNTPRH